MDFRRAAGLLLALGLAGPLLAGCAGTPPITNQVDTFGSTACSRPLVLWPAIGKQEKAYVLEQGKLFQQQTGVGIQILDIPFDDTLRKFVQAVPSGKGPDILLGPSDWGGLLAEGGYVADLTDRYDTSTYLENTVKAGTYAGRLWSVPKSFEVVAQYYNTKLTPEPPQSFEQIKAIQGLQGGQYALAYDITNLYFSAPFLYAVGGQFFDENGKFVLTEEAATQWLTELRDLQAGAALPREVTSESAVTLFNGGNSATYYSGPWDVETLKGSEATWKVADLPSVGGKQAQPFLGTKQMWIPASSPCQGAALAFTQFINRPESDIAWVRDVNPAFLPATKAVYDDPLLAGDENIQAFVRQAESATPFPNSPAVGQIWTPGLDALTEVINQGADPAAAAKKMVSTIADNIEETYGDTLGAANPQNLEQLALLSHQTASRKEQ